VAALLFRLRENVSHIGSFVTYYITQFTIICKWLVIVIKKQGCRPAFSFCVQHIERINFLAIYYMII
jgi:hypothetical protein